MVCGTVGQVLLVRHGGGGERGQVRDGLESELKNGLEDVEQDVVENDGEQDGGDGEDDAVGNGGAVLEHGELEVVALGHDR
jgi:hypothetical protein